MSFDAIIDWVGDGESVIVAMCATTAILCTLLVYRTLLYRDPVADRIASLSARERALRTELMAPRTRQRREQSLGFMRLVVQRLNLLRSKEAKKVSVLLSRAGIRNNDAMVIYFFAKLALPFAFGGLAILYLYVLDAGKLHSGTKLLISLATVVAGAFAPNLYLKNRTDKREQALRKGLPDALDLLVICAEAGQSLDGALNRVSREIGKFSPVVAEELALTGVELGLMSERRSALDNLVQRANIPEIRNVVNALIQTEKYGTPLAQSLRVLSDEYRSDRMMKAEEKAARLPAIMTVPMIVFILPPLFVVLLGPAIMRVLDQFVSVY